MQNTSIKKLHVHTHIHAHTGGDPPAREKHLRHRVLQGAELPHHGGRGHDHPDVLPVRRSAFVQRRAAPYVLHGACVEKASMEVGRAGSGTCPLYGCVITNSLPKHACVNTVHVWIWLDLQVCSQYRPVILQCK